MARSPSPCHGCVSPQGGPLTRIRSHHPPKENLPGPSDYTPMQVLGPPRFCSLLTFHHTQGGPASKRGSSLLHLSSSVFPNIPILCLSEDFWAPPLKPFQDRVLPTFRTPTPPSLRSLLQPCVLNSLAGLSPFQSILLCPTSLLIFADATQRPVRGTWWGPDFYFTSQVILLNESNARDKLPNQREKGFMTPIFTLALKLFM